MHEKRNFVMVLLLIGSIGWAIYAWVFLQAENDANHWTLSQRICSLLLIASLGVWLFYSMKFEDKLPDHLAKIVGPFYYEADGLSFMPIVRINAKGNQAELCVYYQNRFENPVEAIVHLRPPPPEESFIIRPGIRDVHFAFKANGGDFGVIHQPIAVPRKIQGDVIHVKMAAASWYPRSHGARLRRCAGMPCGSMMVDWGGNALKIGVHEVSGEIPLTNPVTLHLAMPDHVSNEPIRAALWKQEQLQRGAVALA